MASVPAAVTKLRENLTRCSERMDMDGGVSVGGGSETWLRIG